MGNVAVYKKGTTDFFSQGLGLLSDVVSSNLTQTVSSTGNVEQKLEVEYPIDGYLVSELVEGAILRVSVSTDKSDYGVFEIVDTLKDDSGTITVYGDPYYNRILRMSFDNGGVFTKFSSVQSSLNAAKQNITGFPADFNLISNLSTSVDLSANTYDTFGTFLEALNSAVHGNIKYSLNSIQIYSAFGKDITDITLRDDMNTSSVKITTDFSGIINKVIPVLPVLDKDGNATDQTKVGTIVTSKYSNQFLDYWAGKVIQFDTQDLANTYFDRTNADRPVQTVDVDPIGLDDDFSTINIFDTIELYSTRLDYTDKLRVSERVFDTLAENVTSFKLGSSSVNIFNQINEQNNEIFNNVVKLTNAAISANGKGIDYFGQAQPASPKEGDTWFWDDGTDFGIKQYNNGEWVDLAGSNTAEKIAAGVTDAVSQANAHTDEVKQGLSTDIDTAKSQAASQASTAEANAKSAATSQFNQAQSALSAAKTDLTNSIASEASARNAAVAAANSQAQTYANQAKADAMSAASSADGVIRTAISSSANSLSATITQNKSSADSGISTAQTTAQAAVDGLAFKVSKTDYDQKTGDLSTKINDVKETADSSAQTIADIKIADGKQDTRMSEIESTASGLKSTVSDLSTAQGKQSGDISTLQQSAKGFEGSIREINNTVNGLGQTNQLMNTEFTPDLQGWENVSPLSITASVDNSNNYNGSNIINLVHGANVQWSQFRQSISNFVKGSQISASVWASATQSSNGSVTIDSYDSSNTRTILAGKALTGTGDVVKFESITIPANSAGVYISLWSQTAGTISFSQPMLVFESTVGQYVQGNYNNNDALAQVKLTADNAALNLSKYQTDADGRISKAQAGVEANANAITQKVSQTDYDKKTGDLTTAVAKAQTTADGVVTTVGNYKTSNDARVKAAESAISQNADAIALKVEKTDYDNNNSQLNTRFTKVETTANGTATTVSNLQQTVNSLGQTNLINNSEFSPDLQGWSMSGSGTYTVGDYDYSGAVLVLTNTGGGIVNLYSSPISLNGSSSMTISWKLNYYIFSVGTNGSAYIYLQYLDSSLNPIPNVFIYAQNVAGSSGKGWTNYIVNNFTLTNMPAGAKYIRLVVDAREKGSKIGINKPMLTLGTPVGAYVAGAYNNNAALAQVKITADGINNFVRDSSGNISSNFQTALSKTSIITGSTLASSIQQQTSSQITSALTDNNGKIISLINQDTSGVQIAGKNIVLDGDTTVTGTFKVSQANIANGAIGTAQIGDAAITSAKIANLDVSKITGDVTNFVKSGWNNAY
ncbi:gp58-like family protein, partial [Leuconostoc falkenbergense]|uniref:gp58-like family protein n=1 Tax=Leuconostoc falkenbergense TaxID=2766470 RepID=UPI0039EAC982